MRHNARSRNASWSSTSRNKGCAIRSSTLKRASRTRSSHPFEFSFLDDGRQVLRVGGAPDDDDRHLRGHLHLCRVLGQLFGLSAFTTEQRTKEIGIRKVCGASVAEIILLLSRRTVLFITAAGIVACIVAWNVMAEVGCPGSPIERTSVLPISFSPSSPLPAPRWRRSRCSRGARPVRSPSMRCGTSKQEDTWSFAHIRLHQPVPCWQWF